MTVEEAAAGRAVGATRPSDGRCAGAPDGGAGAALPGAGAAPRRLWLAVALAASALGAAVTLFAYWPGILIDDSRWQYQQAIDGAYEDWHPPLMAWIWHGLMRITPGPAPMLVLQAALFWGGLALVAAQAWRRGQPAAAAGIACIGWLPVPLIFMGTVLKDALMAGCLVAAVGLLLWRQGSEKLWTRRLLAAGVLVMAAVAAGMRFNAFLACAPLLVALAGERFARTRLRLAATSLAAVAGLMLVPPAIGTLLHAKATDVRLSLIIFDLGGITRQTGVSQFPDMRVPDPVAVNQGCYRPTEWDGYSPWAQRPCALGFVPFRAAVEREHLSATALWARAIVSHPIAYARHRLDHFNVSTWFLVPPGTSDTGWGQSDPNPWNYQVRPNRALEAIGAVAEATGETPLEWPFFWIALAAAALILGASARLSAALQALAASAFLYGAGYLVIGVATGMRYHIWTVTGAALAMVLTLLELMRRRARPSRLATAAAVGIVALPCLMAAVARLV